MREEEIYFDTGGGDCEGMRQRVVYGFAKMGCTLIRGQGKGCATFIYTKARGWCRDAVSAMKLPLVKPPSRRA